jgi:hypothetical protein
MFQLRVRHFYNENNPDKGSSYRMLLAKCKERGYLLNTSKKPEIYNYHEGQNKQYKIQTHLLHHWQNIVWDMVDSDRRAVDQVCDYQEGAEPDDMPDSMASLLRCFYNDTSPDSYAKKLAS